MGDEETTPGVTDLNQPFLLSYDEFLRCTTIHTADIKIKSKDSGSPFDAKRLYEEYKFIHWLDIIHRDMYGTYFTLCVFLNARIQKRSEKIKFANAGETQSISAVLFIHLRIFATKSAVQKRPDIATLSLDLQVHALV